MQYPEETVQSQYAASPTIRALVDGFNTAVDPRADIKLFYDRIFNPATAQGVGLDIWARIVGVERNVFVEDLTENFGFFVSGGTPSEEAYAIPAAIQSLPGYGWSAGTAFNYVDFDRKVYVQNVAAVDMGTLTWAVNSGGFRAQDLAGTIKPPTDNNTTPNVITTMYAPTPAGNRTGKDDVICVFSSGNIFVLDASYSTAEDFQTAMSGVMLQYELATPVETDISAYLTSTPELLVEPDTALTFGNTSEMAVPSAISYTVDGETVTDSTEAYAKTIGDADGAVTIHSIGGKTVVSAGALVSAAVTEMSYLRRAIIQQDWQPWDQGVFYEPGIVKKGSYRIDDTAFREFILWKALANISTADAYTLNRLLSKLFNSPVIVTETGVMQIRITTTSHLEDWQRAVLTQYGLFGKPAGVGFEFWTIETPVLGFVEDGDNYMPLGQAPFYNGVMERDFGGD